MLQPMGCAEGFGDAFAQVASVAGWLTEDQARVLYDAARAAGPGARVLEVGSHHGRSTIVLALAGAAVTAVDPFPDDWRYGAADTEQRCRANLARAGVTDRVDLRVATSREVRATWDTPLDVVYVDGKHDVWSVRDDLRWAGHVRDGGVVLVHDAFSSLGVTLGLLSVLPGSRRLRYAGRTGSLARLEVGRPTLTDRARLLAPLPWFARNLVVKVLLRLRLRPVARLLGHDDSADPY